MSNAPIIVREEFVYSPMADTVGQWHLFENESELLNYICTAAVALVMDDLLETEIVDDATDPPSLSEVIEAAMSGDVEVDEEAVALARRIAEGGDSVEESWTLLCEVLAKDSNYSFEKYYGFMALVPYLEAVEIEIAPARLRKADLDRSVAEEILDELEF